MFDFEVPSVTPSSPRNPRRLTPWERDLKLAATPQAADLYGPAPLGGLGGEESGLTPSQALAITLARRKSYTPPTEEESAGSRYMRFAGDIGKCLEICNERWGTDYTATDVRTTAAWLARVGMTINVPLLKDTGGWFSTTVADSLVNNYRLKNAWETKDRKPAYERKRAAVETAFGYALPLIHLDEPGRKAELPIYGALNVTGSRTGAAPEYGLSHLVLKESVRARSTVTPGDSFAMVSKGDFSRAWVPFAFPADDPRGLLLTAGMPERLRRYAFAAATGRDATWLASPRARRPPRTGEYLELQIHGGVTWNDVSELVVGDPVCYEVRDAMDMLKSSHPHVVITYHQ